MKTSGWSALFTDVIGRLLFALVLLSVSACQSSSTAASVSGDSLPVAEPVIANSDNILTIYNWDTYIDPQILVDFESKFGVTIDYRVYDSDLVMLDEMLAGETPYDLIVPSDYVTDLLRREKALHPLNKENIPNFANLAPDFVNPSYDPGNRYCAPYQWGTIGIGYNLAATGREIAGWKDVFDPQFAGEVSLMDEPRYTLGVVLIYLGYSPNTTNSAEIQAAVEFLDSHSDQFGGFSGDDAQDLLADGTFDLVMEWSGDIFQLMEDNPDIRYVIPEEGSILWTDNICIPATSQHKELAEQFINYLLEPEVGAALSNFVRYGSPNQAALPFIADRQDESIYPQQAVRDRLFLMTGIGMAGEQLYESQWEQVLAEAGF